MKLQEYSTRRDKTWKVKEDNLVLMADKQRSPQSTAEDLKLAKKVTSTPGRFDIYQKL